MRTRSIQSLSKSPLAYRVPLHNNTRAIPAYFFILITLPGWFFAFLTGNTIVADLSGIIGVIACVIWIWNGVVGKSLEMVRFVRLGAAWLCLIQNFSWLTASYLHRFSLDIPIEQSLSTNMANGTSVAYYALAILYTSCFCMFLSFFGSLKSVLKLEIAIYLLLRSLKKIKIKTLTFALLIPIGIEIFMIASGIVGQRTLVIEGYSEGELPGWLVFYDTVLTAQIIFNALLTNLILKRTQSKKVKFEWIILILSVLILFFIFFNKGRGATVFSLLTLGYWFVFYNEMKPKFYKVIIIISIIYPILSQILLFNNFIRSRAAGLDVWRGSAIEVVPQAWEKFQQSDELQMLEGKRTERNLSTRPLVAMPLAMCIELDKDKKRFMLGKNILHSFIWALPGPVFPNKADYPILEGLLYEYFPIGEADTVDSIYLSSYNEFGWLGMMIYPALLTGLWMVVITCIKFFKLSVITAVICISIFFEMFILGIGESAVNNWLISFRTLVLWIIVDRVFKLIFAGRKKRIKHKIINQQKISYKTLQRS